MKLFLISDQYKIVKSLLLNSPSLPPKSHQRTATGALRPTLSCPHLRPHLLHLSQLLLQPLQLPFLFLCLLLQPTDCLFHPLVPISPQFRYLLVIFCDVLTDYYEWGTLASGTRPPAPPARHPPSAWTSAARRFGGPTARPTVISIRSICAWSPSCIFRFRPCSQGAQRALQKPLQSHFLFWPATSQVQ